jgi:ABC-type sugar transport system ATPase subunit
VITKTDIQNLKSRLEQSLGKREMLQSQLKSANDSLVAAESRNQNSRLARIIVQTVAEETQKKIEYQISNIVSLALVSVFPDPYECKLQFVKRRNKMEADILFLKNGNEGKPIEIAGGGTLDVASFALKTAIWAIKPTNNVMILDEPFHFLSRDLQSKCSQMIKMIQEKMKIQFIIVSHIPEITESADRIFNVENIKGISKVKQI